MCKRGKLSWHSFRSPLIAASLILSVGICLCIFPNIQDAYAQMKAPISTLEEETVEKQNTKEKVKTPNIEPEIHRRILHFLNTARRPEDLMTPPHNMSLGVLKRLMKSIIMGEDIKNMKGWKRSLSQKGLNLFWI